MTNVQAKEKLLKEFDIYWVEVDKTEYGYQIKEDLKKIFFQALDRLEEQTKRETIEIIKGFGYTDLQILDEIDNEQGDGMADFMRGYNEALNKILAKLKAKNVGKDKI